MHKIHLWEVYVNHLFPTDIRIGYHYGVTRKSRVYKGTKEHRTNLGRKLKGEVPLSIANIKKICKHWGIDVALLHACDNENQLLELIDKGSISVAITAKNISEIIDLLYKFGQKSSEKEQKTLDHILTLLKDHFDNIQENKSQKQ